MKYENFKRVKELVEQIDKDKKTLEEMSGDNVSVKIMDGQFTVMTAGTWGSCEHSCQDLASNFVQSVISHYKEKLSKQYSELNNL